MIFGLISVNDVPCCRIDGYGLCYDPPMTGQMSVFEWIDQPTLQDTTETPADALLEIIDDEGPSVLGSETFFDFELIDDSNPAEVTFYFSGLEGSL